MPVELYRNSFSEAERKREIGRWRESHAENVRCKNRFDDLISQNFDGYHLKGNVIKDMCDEFGLERVRWVLTNTIRENMEDGRYRPETKAWGGEIYFPRGERNHEFALNSHPEIVNGLVNQYRRYVRQDLGIFDVTDCIQVKEAQDYEDKLLILKSSVLKEDYKKGEFQLFYAQCGFGCSPSAEGRKVFGKFLIDGEETHFQRNDFYGIADESKLPDWAVEKLNEIRSDETEGMVQQ